MEKRIEVAMSIKKTADGKKFPVYSSKMVDGNWIQTKFTRDCCSNAAARGILIPSTDNDKKRFIMVVDSDNCNVSKNGLYDVLWVKTVEAIEEIPTTNKVDSMF